MARPSGGHRLPRTTAWAAVCEAAAGLGLIAIGTADQPRTALFIFALVIPSLVVAAATAAIAVSGLTSGRVRTGWLVAMQVLWLGWTQTFGQGVNGGTLANIFGGAFVISAIVVLACAAGSYLVGGQVLEPADKD